MRIVFIAFFTFLLTGCTTVMNNNYCLRGRSPGEIPKKFEQIKIIAMEEAVNSGITSIDENAPYIIKPSRGNRWKGEITYTRPEIHEQPETQPLFSIKFNRNRVCFVNTDVANLTDDRPRKTVTAIIDRVKKLR